MKILSIILVLASFPALSVQTGVLNLPQLLAAEGCAGTLTEAVQECGADSDNAVTEAEKDAAEACLSALIHDDITFQRGPNTLQGKAAVLGFFRFFRGPVLSKSQTFISDHRIFDASNVHGVSGDEVTLVHTVHDIWDVDGPSIIPGSNPPQEFFPFGPLGAVAGATLNINTCKLDNGVWKVFDALLIEKQPFEPRTCNAARCPA